VQQRCFSYRYCDIVEGSLEVKLPTIWTDGKAQRKSEERRSEMEKIREGESQKKEDAGARKGI
jgi:hypothetical protein